MLRPAASFPKGPGNLGRTHSFGDSAALKRADKHGVSLSLGGRCCLQCRNHTRLYTVLTPRILTQECVRPAAAFPKGAGSLALAELPRLQLSFVDADGQVSLSLSIYISIYNDVSI